jgi:hypothetical protein
MLSNSASLDPYVPTPGAAPSSTAYYGPRFDYDPVTLLPRGFLVEEQRTNSLKQSADFPGAEWSVTGVASRTNNSIAPDGLTTGCTVVEDTATSVHWVLAAGTNRPTPGNVATTTSVYLKAGTRRYVNFSVENSGNGYNATVDTVGWSITQQGLTGTGWVSGSATLSAAGNGWYRLAITVTPPAATSVSLLIAGAPASSSVRQVSYTGDGSTWIIWGAQLEAGAFATSYIPTIASTVTRSADVATITGSLFSQWYNQPEGGFIVEADTVQSVDPSATAASDGTLNNRIQLFFGAASHLFVRVGGVTQADLDAGSITLNTPAKLAAAYKLNDFAASLNGGAAVTDTSGSLPTADRLSIGTNPSAAAQLNGHIRSIRYVPVRAADFQLQALTAPPELLSLNIYDRFNDLVLDRAGQTIEVR